jgi:hypothetical protein
MISTAPLRKSSLPVFEPAASLAGWMLYNRQPREPPLEGGGVENE